MLLLSIIASLAIEITTIAIGILLTLIGIVYKQLRKNTNTNSTKITKLEERIDTMQQWAFGSKQVANDYGISKDVEDGFNTLDEELSKTEEKVNKLETRVARLERDIGLIENKEEENIPLESQDD